MAIIQKNKLSIRQRVINLVFTKLARMSSWLFIAGIIGGVLGYVYQVIMGRMLSLEAYGLFSAVMALFAVLSAPLATLQMVIARKVSEYKAKKDKGSCTHFYYTINARTFFVGVVLLVIFLIFSPQIQIYLKAPNIIVIYMLGAMLFLTFPALINNSFLQGLQLFSWLSVCNPTGVLFRIIFSVIFIFLGYGVAGALGGVIIASFVVWGMTYIPLHGPLNEGRNKSYNRTHLSTKVVFPVLIANIAFTAMTQLDMVLVNFYFPSHEVGLYAAASVLGKAVMYLPGGIVLALFPMVAENHARNESSSGLFLQAIGLTILLCSIGSIFYFIFGEWFIAILYGENYQGAGDVLKYYGFAVLPMALVLIAENFLIAKGRVLFAYLFVFIAPLQFIAIYFYHDTLQTVVAIMGASGLLLAFIGYGLLWLEFQKSKNEKKIRIYEKL
jgi:O-antigen/teichoic acid export membrane protein